MPFTLIKGRFKPKVGNPDGDSVRFLADNPDLWVKLKGKPPQLGKDIENKNTVQLRFEAIDTVEKGAAPALVIQSLDSMLRLIGFTADNPEPAGYILSRMTDDLSGRPIAFVFPGVTDWEDGAEVWLDAAMIRESVNAKQAEAGWAYPLYYNTLFASLRHEMNRAIIDAQADGRGYWPEDRTVAGVTVNSYSDLAAIPPIWPKLWRRLEEYLRNHSSLDGFVDFLARRNERVNIIPTLEECGLQDLVEVMGNQVRLIERPENLQVVDQAGKGIG